MIISKENDRKSPKIGEVYTGKVIKIVPFGAFVDFGFEKDGLVHISEIEEQRIDRVESVLSMDQEVKIRMIGFNEKGSPKLSIKKANNSYVPQDPPKEDKVYKGIVKSIKEFGAFVDFGFEKDGLVHISEIAENRIRDVESVLSMDQEVDVRFIGVDDRGRFKLSIRRAFPRVNDEA